MFDWKTHRAHVDEQVVNESKHKPYEFPVSLGGYGFITVRFENGKPASVSHPEWIDVVEDEGSPSGYSIRLLKDPLA